MQSTGRVRVSLEDTATLVLTKGPSSGIRSAILDGNVDKALKWTNAHYTSVLSDNENIYFKLRCRKFIEMIRRCTDLQSPSGKSDSKSRSNSGLARTTTNGHSGNADGDHGVFDEDMELDDAPGDHSTANGGDNDTEMADSDWYSQQNSLMGEALRYGQELQSEFKDDPRREVKQALEDTFALIAYPNAKESSLAPLLETDGRIPVAEELNSAILGKRVWRTASPLGCNPSLIRRLHSIARQIIECGAGAVVPTDGSAPERQGTGEYRGGDAESET